MIKNNITTRLSTFSLLVVSTILFNATPSFAEEPIILSTVETDTAASKKQSGVSPWFYGGGLALSFGDVEYYEISPMIGYTVNPKTAVGVSFLYRYRTDNRFSQSYSTTDYGTTLFARYNLTPSFFLQAEYEYIDYEFAVLSGTNIRTERDTFDSFLAGGGIQKSLGGNASMYFTALYNFNYNDPGSPYSEPVTIRFGVGVGF